MMKGLSPLIATVLLVGFTVAIAGLISVWLSQLTGTTTDVTGTAAERQTKCTSVLQISEVTYALGSSVDQMNVTVEYTYGTEDLYFFNFSIVDDIKSSATVSPVQGENYNKTYPFRPGNLRVFNLTITDSARVIGSTNLPGGKVDSITVQAKCLDTITVAAQCESGDPCLKST